MNTEATREIRSGAWSGTDKDSLRNEIEQLQRYVPEYQSLISRLFRQRPGLAQRKPADPIKPTLSYLLAVRGTQKDLA